MAARKENNARKVTSAIKGTTVRKGATDPETRKHTPISTTHRPENMSYEEWQRALRREVAGTDSFGIRGPYGNDDVYVVSSARSGRTYRVHFYGPGSSDNRCECMDYKTNRLGTCKHIEALSLAREDRRVRPPRPTPAHPFVYVDYPAGRKIKIYRGESVSAELNSLIDTLFDGVDELKDLQCDPSEFIRRAKEIDASFEWEPDALGILIDERDRARRRRIIQEKYATSLFDGLIATSLHPYQADGVRFAFAEGRTINADEMGLGKTVQAIATAELLKREGLVGSVLIICPTSLKYQWLSEIRRFTRSSVIVVEGDMLKRRNQLDDLRYFYKICSFQSMSNNLKADFIPQADMVIYDELQRLKNRDTQMGKQLRKLQSQYVMALSGTPLENKLDELYSVTQLVDQYVLGPYYKFRAETTLTDELGKIVGYRNLHDVAQRLRHTLIRRRKADVKLQMPARTDTILFVPMTKEQRAIHEEYQYQVSMLIDKWHRFKFLSEADRKRLLLFLSMMRMVCDSTFVLDQKSRHDTKIEEIKAIVSNMLDEGSGKVVIFSQWERMLRILAGELKDAGMDFCFLHGAVPSVKRKDLIDRFRDDPDCRIFLSTDAGSTGLNLQSASLLINIDLPWNPAVLEQRIARIYRLGQNNPVQIINMVAKGTIEERMLSTLNFKSNLAAGILDGGEDAVFIENSKFDRIVETVDSIITPESQDADEPAEPNQPRANHKEAQNHSGNSGGTTASGNSGASHSNPGATASGVQHPTEQKSGEETGVRPVGEKSAPTPKSPEEMRDLVAGGFAALGKLAEALRDPASVKAMADALVKEDPGTGNATLSIPVPDKATVVNILSAFSSLLNRH